MNNKTFDTVASLIQGAKQIAVVLGEQPDIDVTAAGLALYLSLASIGKRVEVIAPQPPTVALGNLVGANKIKQAFGGNAAGFVISLPYQQGAIEKISYDIVGDRINLTVVPGPQGLTFTTDDITFQSPSQQPDLLISVGIPTETQVSTIANDTQSPLINIDNSFDNPGFGSVAVVDTQASSRSELVAKLLLSMNAPIDRDVAQNLLSGIVDVTDNFQREDTAPSAFEVAGTLIAKGAKRTLGGVSRGDSQQAQGLAAWQKQPLPKPASPFDAYDDTVPVRSGIATKKAVPQPRIGREDTQEDNGSAKQPGAPQAPKDWLEPKIYKGSRATPIS